MNFVTAVAWIAVILGGCVWALGIGMEVLSMWAKNVFALIQCLQFTIYFSFFPLLGAVWLWVTRGS